MLGADGLTGTTLLFLVPSLQDGAFLRIPPSAEARNGQLFGAQQPTKGIVVGERSRNVQTLMFSWTNKTEEAKLGMRDRFWFGTAGCPTTCVESWRKTDDGQMSAPIAP